MHASRVGQLSFVWKRISIVKETCFTSEVVMCQVRLYSRIGKDAKFEKAASAIFSGLVRHVKGCQPKEGKQDNMSGTKRANQGE